MSGSRGRPMRGGPNNNNLDFGPHNYSNPRWQNQQSFVNPMPHQSSWNEDSWAWSQVNEGWDQNTHESWPQQQHFRGRGGRHFGRGFSQYHQQQNYNPHYRDRTGIQGEHGSGTGRGAYHQSFPQRGTGVNQIGLQFPSTSRSGGKVENQSSVTPASKPPSTETSTTFRPPNVDLTNKVKEKLKMFQASKEQNSAAPSQTVPLNRSEPVTSSSPSTPRTRASRVSGDRVAAAATSPSTTTVARIANKSPASSSAVSSVEPDSVLEGIGFIQRTSSAASVEFPEDRSNSGTPEEDELAGEAMVCISKEAMNNYIKKMDNQQRRQLIEQPRGSLPQYMLDHLIQENHLAQSRQLASLRFLRFSHTSEGSSSNSDMDTSSKTDDHVIVPQDFLEQVKELLENNDVKTTDSLPTEVNVRDEDDEIELLEPPVKEPPPCIDLDLEDSSDGPTSNPLSVSSVKVSPVSEERNVQEKSLVISLTSEETSDLPEVEGGKVIAEETDQRIVNCTAQVVEEPTQVMAEKPRNSSEVELVPNTSSNSLDLLVLNLQMEENSENMRVAEIDRKIEELQKERKLVLQRVMALKQKQIDAYRSVMENRLNDSSLLSIGGKPETTASKAPVSTSSSTVADRTSTDRTSDQLKSLMQQLEENGVNVAFGESSSKQSGATKRKRLSKDTGERAKKKTFAKQLNESSGPNIGPNAGSSNTIPLLATSPVNSSQARSSIESLVPNDSTAMSSLPSATNSGSKTVRNGKKKEKSAQNSTDPAIESKKSKKKSKEKKSPNDVTGKKKKLKKKSPVKNVGDTSTQPLNAPVASTATPQSAPISPQPNQTVDPPLTAPANRLSTHSFAAGINANAAKGLAMTSMRDPHDKGVRCMFILGSILFTASEDGTVLVHDVETGIRAMRLTGHEEPITWLYAVLVRAPTKSLHNATVATFLDHLDLVTGSEDGCIRQFTMKTGECRAETSCAQAVTCVTGDSKSGKLYIGSVDGTIYSYNPKAITVDKVKYKVDREILCLKVSTYKHNRVLIVSAKHKDPFVYNLNTDEIVLSLVSNTSNLSISCISVFGNSIFCCDASKKVFTFDWTNDKPLQQVDSISSCAVGSFHWRERFLLLGCIDGTIRVMDTLGKPPTKTFALPTLTLKALGSLGCMKVAGGKVICGTQTGEVIYFSLAEVESMIKTAFRVF